jgi:hypothetical protein
VIGDARRMISSGALIVALAAPGSGHAEDQLRCRSGRLINVGMIDVEVIGRCGEPRDVSVDEAPVLARNPLTRTVAPTGEVKRTERWIYERGQGQFDAALTFENGKLLRIELLTKP